MAHEVELILLRRLAEALAMPILVADAAGDLVFFNEPAEKIVGVRLDEAGEMRLEERTRVFAFLDENGNPLPRDEYPLIVALRQRRPAHRHVVMHGYDGVARAVEVTAFPLEGGGGRLLGGVAFFWEQSPG